MTADLTAAYAEVLTAKLADAERVAVAALIRTGRHTGDTARSTLKQIAVEFADRAAATEGTTP